MTDQVFKLTCDVEHRFEEINKSGIVLADLTAAHDSLPYGAKTLRPPLTCFYFYRCEKSEKCAFFTKLVE